jgi:double-stranded uracil-DNA glycosylase
MLVLGSMPGAASLAAQQYYAHPRNHFWPVWGALLGFDAGLGYRDRVEALRHGGVALWDVLGACERAGSLDADIDLATAEVNDFTGLLATCPRIARVLCNGATAHQLFVRRALPALPAAMSSRLQVLKLPSTSPANAGWPFERRLAAWREAASR